MKKSTKFVTHTPSQTKKLGFALGKEVLQGGLREHATVIGLQGELGAGKTTFAQGVAKGLGIKEKILSPTFVIMKKFQIPSLKFQASPKLKTQNPKFTSLYHIDCYRIEGPRDLLAVGWDKIVSDPKNLVLIEWPERIKKILPKDTISISFKTIQSSNAPARKITFS